MARLDVEERQAALVPVAAMAEPARLAAATALAPFLAQRVFARA